MQNWYKNVFVDATVQFQLPYIYADLNCFVEPWLHGIRTEPPKYSSPFSVLRELHNKRTVYETP